jgi:hypothetical protein
MGADITLCPGSPVRPGWLWAGPIKRPKALLPWVKSTAGGGGDNRKEKEALKQHVGIVRISLHIRKHCFSQSFFFCVVRHAPMTIAP